MTGYIDDTAKIVNSKTGENAKVYRNVVISNSELKEHISIGDDTVIERCKLGEHIAINRRNYINDTIIGDYSYTGINTIINFSQIGKFCSIAPNVYIGGSDHDYNKVTTMPMFRYLQMKDGKKPSVNSKKLCKIGNDVWIAANAQILGKANVGDGAVIGAGAVVTKDVPPYAIVAGTPARIIKYRFNEKIIEELLEIKWWDWPENVILENIEWLINSDINEEIIRKMKRIKNSVCY